MTVSKSEDSFFSSNSFLTFSIVSEGRISIKVLHVSFLIKVSWNAEMKCYDVMLLCVSLEHLRIQYISLALNYL